MKKSAILGLVLILSGAAAFSQSEFYFRLSPGMVIPAGEENIRPGFGLEAAFDWTFWPLPKNMRLGLTLGGVYAGLSSAEKTSLTFLEAGLGAVFQWRISDRFSFRGALGGGIYHYDWDVHSGFQPQFGLDAAAAYHLRPAVSLFVQAGYTFYSLSPASPINGISLGVGVSLNLRDLLNPVSKIDGSKTEQQRIFPVSYAWYEENEIARVRITNNEPNTITDVSLSFFLERYMNQPTVFATLPSLGPGETAEFPVTALFNESMLDLTENTTGNAQIMVNFRSLGARRSAGFPVQMPVFHRNAMSWDDDRRAAAFVSARDPAAVYFARYVDSSIRREIGGSVSPKVQLAAALFEALYLFGINYVVDPSSSYVELSENATALDSLNYPYQTLMFRGGDCDDLSILFCSLLEVLGIETAFITIPGHIYCALALESGPDGNPAGWDPRGLIEQGGRYWLPVELTVPRRGFAEALNLGLRQWRAAGDEARLYPTHESWELYPPVSVPGSGERLPEMPGEAEILKRWQECLRTIR